mgnify:CR=1 FL=1
MEYQCFYVFYNHMNRKKVLDADIVSSEAHSGHITHAKENVRRKTFAWLQEHNQLMRSFNRQVKLILYVLFVGKYNPEETKFALVKETKISNFKFLPFRFDHLAKIAKFWSLSRWVNFNCLFLFHFILSPKELLVSLKNNVFWGKTLICLCQN